MKKELIELKDTYYPYWQEMLEHTHAKKYYSPLNYDKWEAKLQSILIRCQDKAIDKGFEVGWKFSLDQIMNIVERSSFSVEVKELLRQMIEIQKTKIT
jgi:hypothetical protein